MAFQIFGEEILILTGILECFKSFEKFFSDCWLANFLKTNKVNSLENGKTNLMNNLLCSFLLCCPPIFLDYSFVFRTTVRIIGSTTFVISISAWNIEVTIDAKYSEFSHFGPLCPFVVFWSLFEVFVDSGLFVVSWIILIRGLFKSVVFDCRKAQWHLKLLELFDFVLHLFEVRPIFIRFTFIFIIRVRRGVNKFIG